MKLVGIERRRREPDELAKLRVSVRNHCLECGGYMPSEVKECTVVKCWLWPWRFGKTPAGYRDLVKSDVVGDDAEISDVEDIVDEEVDEMPLGADALGTNK